ncbi:MAG TPA: PKD domain-containing protein [Baekduia sp.]
MANGSGRLLAVGVSTTAGGTVTGVTYGGQALTSRVADGAVPQSGPGTHAEIWTLSNPPVGSATVTVTFAGSVSAVIGAASFTGVDPVDPVIVATSDHEDGGQNSADISLNNTVAADGMFGVIALDNLANTSEPTVGGATDLVVPTQLWKATSGVHGAAAARSGNTGANQATSAGINWHWTFLDSNQRNPFTQVVVALRHGSLAVAPTVTTPTDTAVTTTSATLGGTVTSDGGSALSERGVVFCASPCTPALGGAGMTKVASATATTGTFTVPVGSLASSTGYSFRAYATNAVGTAYSASGSFTTATPNHAPTASAGGPYTIAEGSGVTLDASASADPDGDALTYTWDIDGDGAYGDATGVAPTLTAAQLAGFGLGDGPATKSVRVRVSDGSLSTTSAATTVTVTNAAPSATLGNDGPVVEGSDATVSFTGATDPSSADTAAGFRYAYDLDDDGTWDVGDGTYGGSTTSATATLPTTDDGTRTVRAAIIDKDGGTKLLTTIVTVTNAAPSATLSNDGPVVEGSDATVSFTGASDPSSADTVAGFRYAYDLNDDGTYDIGDGTYGGSSTSATATLPTTDDGTQIVRAAIIDKDGDATVLTTTVTATNAAPTATATPAGAVLVNADLALALTATDPSSADAAADFTYIIDWGDGTVDTVTGPAAASATHAYAAAGTYTISVVGTDKNGGSSAPATATATVTAPPPPEAPADTTPTAATTTAPPPPAPVAAASVSKLVKVESLSVAPRCVAAAAATTRSVKIRYRLSTAATVRVAIQRSTGSHAVRKCPPVRGSAQPDGKLKPGSYTSVSVKQATGSSGGTTLTIAQAGKGGAVGTTASLRPQALLAKGKKLSPGTYLLTVTVLGADGKAQGSARVKFWVLKR